MEGLAKTYDTLLVETHDDVRLIRLNRPQALSALNDQMMDDLTAALDEAGGPGDRLHRVDRPR